MRKYIPAIEDITKTQHSALELAREARAQVFGHIYFLIDKGDVVYVGQSKSYKARIQTHTDGEAYVEQKEFTHYSILEVKLSEMDVVEQVYIQLLHPKYNKAVTNPAARKVVGWIVDKHINP